MSIIQLIFIAFIQGITEWLPISSSAHVMLASDLVGLVGQDEVLLNAASNTGTLIAMLLYFRKDVGAAILGGFELLGAPVTKRPLSSGARLALCILVATPFALLGAVIYESLAPDAVWAAMRSVYAVAASTIVFGALLWWADAKGAQSRSEGDMTLRDAFLIGASQLIAVIIPGTSRSGITMTAARALGYERVEAARFAMLIGAPILAAVSLYGMMGLATAPADGAGATMSDGLIVAALAFVSGYASIGLLMALLRKMSFLPFVLYRFALGIALLATSPIVAGSLG
ncbi:MAG: undecaprenyl-diphosphate phosphatase [Hyphomonas sp.]